MASKFIQKTYSQMVLLFSISLFHIFFTPFTKVEESFNIQAIHDFIYIGFPRTILTVFQRFDHEQSTYFSLYLRSILSSNIDKSWDHENFPGPVPRTFLGSLIIAFFAYPLAFILDKSYVLLCSRAILSFLVLLGFGTFANQIGKQFGSTKRFLLFLTLTQFHFIYYSSRPLPNIFALILVLLSASAWLSKRINTFIFLVAFTVIIFRFETCLLFIWMIIYDIFNRNLSYSRLFCIGLPAGIIALSTTLLFDSLIWGKFIWPEGYSIYFNIYLNKSKEWGTQPFFWYFYSALPRSILFSLLFVPLCSKKCFKSLLFVSFMFILTYSFLGHKELRFIIYAVPFLNACAANSISILFKTKTEKGSSYFSQIWLYCLIQRIIGESKKDTNKQNKYVKKLTNIELSKSNVGDKISIIRKRKFGEEYYKDEIKNNYIDNLLFDSKKVDAFKKKTNKVKPKKGFSFALIMVFLLVGIHICCNFGITMLASLASWNNYPGGEAIVWTNNYIRKNYDDNGKNIIVHVSNLACQTGFSRFLQLNNITYDKSSNLKSFLKKFDHINIEKFKMIYFILEKVDYNFFQSHCSTISYSKLSKRNNVCAFGKKFYNCKMIKVINAYDGINYRFNLTYLIIKKTPKLWIFRCDIKE